MKLSVPSHQESLKIPLESLKNPPRSQRIALKMPPEGHFMRHETSIGRPLNGNNQRKSGRIERQNARFHGGSYPRLFFIYLFKSSKRFLRCGFALWIRATETVREFMGRVTTLRLFVVESCRLIKRTFSALFSPSFSLFLSFFLSLFIIYFYSEKKYFNRFWWNYRARMFPCRPPVKGGTSTLISIGSFCRLESRYRICLLTVAFSVVSSTKFLFEIVDLPRRCFVNVIKMALVFSLMNIQFIQ